MKSRLNYVKILLSFVCCVGIFAAIFSNFKPTSTSYFRVQGNRFTKGGTPYFVYSFNYWQFMHLGAQNRTRLINDLDQMKSIGINALRIMATSEGPDDEPYRVKPSLMPSPGVYNDPILDGLDFAMNEASKRGFAIIFCLNNFWHWSGGFAAYVSWVENSSIPYPASWDPKLNDYTNGSIVEFESYAKRLYNNSETNQLFKNHISFMLNRRNRYNGWLYREDPSIFSVQIANEPQSPSLAWVNDLAAFIKQVDGNHLISTGLESRFDYNDFMNGHKSANIDYCTIHVWAQNRGIYDMLNPSESNIKNATDWAIGWLLKVDQWARTLQKPLILEEFGLARDNFLAKSKDDIYSYNHPTSRRDRYFKALFDTVFDSYKTGNSFSGLGIWSYGGEARPGDYLLGDPKHEAPGWYDIYNTDNSTIELLIKYSAYF